MTRGGLRRLRRAAHAAPPAAGAAVPSRGRLSLFDGDHRLAAGQRPTAVQGMVLFAAPIVK